MRSRLLAFVVLCALLPFLTGATIVIRGPRVAASATPALIASVEENGTANTVTTASINTTGANLIVVNVAWFYDVSVDPDVTDSKGNTYTKLTRSTISNATNTLFYCYGGTVGSGHTFTFAGTTTYPSIQVIAISNIAAAPFDQQNGNTAASPSTLTTGSITPSQANTVAVIGVAFETAAGTPTVNTSGFSTPVASAYDAGNSYGGAISYKVLTTADALNPEWAFSPSQTRAAARIANFKY